MGRKVITVDNISKRYRIGAKEEVHDTIAGYITDLFKSPLKNLNRIRKLSRFKDNESEEDIIWALKDFSFSLNQGDVLGIIGRNGAGKSTLLKVLSRITRPTTGSIEIEGRVASLLEVGTGFHFELSGRENIYLNGTILGMKKNEIDSKFDEIVEFSGVDKFIDTPIKRYSTGMTLRLAFAVAAFLEPEILIIDEVLAVGDVAFQKKCIGKMSEVAKDGRTILFVSHNMSSIKLLCNKCMLIDDGKLQLYGDTEEVIDSYLERSFEDANNAIKNIRADKNKTFQVRVAKLLNSKNKVTQKFDCDEDIIVSLECDVQKNTPDLLGYLSILKRDGSEVMVSDSFDTTPNPFHDLNKGVHHFNITIPKRSLAPGAYHVYLNFTLATNGSHNVDSPQNILSFSLDDMTSRRGNRRTGYFSTMLNWERIR